MRRAPHAAILLLLASSPLAQEADRPSAGDPLVPLELQTLAAPPARNTERPGDATTTGSATEATGEGGKEAATEATAEEPLSASDAPVLQVTFEETEAIPGQPLSLRLTVLAPTFMPDPPVWPSLEAPNLLVRLPERSTGPTSEEVGGETWSGVTRHYRISPMVPGEFAIPPQEVIVTWADPETSEPRKVTLTTEPLTFSGVLPEGAEGLDPFIAAEALELKQEVAGEPEAMQPGDSVTRTIKATIRGTSPMFLPALLPPTDVAGVAAYPDEPVLEESDDRGVLEGTRAESVTLVAEGGGSGEAPAVSLDWYNLKSGEVETASVDGFPIEVDGPPASSAEPRDWRAIGLASLAALLALAVVAWLLRRLLPPFGRWLRERRTERLASEGHAFGQLQRAVARRDEPALRPALDAWAAKVEGHDPREHPGVRHALVAIGAARYGRGASGDAGAGWRALAAALPEARRDALARDRLAALPPLNPGASGGWSAAIVSDRE
ncbi:MAG: BatD family protein [Geminicoccaceae bacterium]|jgi:hypothetical protein|nr:BatD family protein [Geminicoccaceae bacterium]HRY25891.1 hypothetical protein [Geminicoccaceae bacterium]